ncbi:MAG TPA: hypothetical protein DDW52_03575 [Planctomycetaceae bacterium]|nr:hypothetical protein [Planctomycetaceae bacterium]
MVTQIGGAIDLLPTLCELAGVPVLDGSPLDGISLVPLLTGQTAALPERKLFSHWAGRVSVRNQHFRLDHQGKLYDMLADPGQTRDVSLQRPALAQELRGAADAFRRDVLSELKREPRPFTVGHRDFPLTQLPARDAIASGGIERSAKAPNCSYFKNWTSAQDEISWDVDVLHPGRFQVQMFHSASPSSVGANVSLSLGDSATSAVIQAAHTPPAVGPEHDRVKRITQSPMKEFAPLDLGVIELPAGRNKLLLKATPSADEMQLEMRLLMLRRVR